MPQNMVEILPASAYGELDAFVASHPSGHFMQTSMWARQKPEWQHAALALRDGYGNIRASFLLLIRKVPKLPYTLVYGSRGPVCDADDEAAILDLLTAAKNLARRFRAYCVKVDPAIPSVDGEVWTRALARCGFLQHADTKNFESAQPRYVFWLDVRGKSQEEIFAGFHSKWRYNVRVAERKEVTVRITGEEGLDEFARLMRETGERDGFVTRPRAYFTDMLRNLGDSARLYMAYLPDGTAIAGTLAIAYARRVWYLYGASSNEHRDYMPNYLLQWEMIKWAIECGCDTYDFRGVSGDLSESNPLYGLYRFKKGFGGELTEFIGEYDYVTSKLINWAVTRGKKMLVRRAMKK